jgi:CTP:molybdopterin cytidylyltransferase MocA
MTDALHVVILAAGEGKRMNSAKPKVLLPVAGRPMLAHVIDAARALGAEAIHSRATAIAAKRCARPSPATPTCAGSSRSSSWVPAMRCSRRCPRFPMAHACWCCMATCR